MAVSFGILLASGRAAPVALSAMAHVVVAGALVLSVGGHAPVTDAGPLAVIALEPLERTDAVAEAEPPTEQARSTTLPARVASHVPPTHTHAYPVPEDHDAHPHDPAIHHVSGAESAVAAPALTSDAPMPRFTIAIGAAPESHGAVGGTALVGTPSVDGSTKTFGDDEVSRRAQLTASAVAAYPPAARAGELEADVPLEIVVDPTGHVLDARVTTRAGSGFDESALAAIRSYRFAPAMRDGKAVRVRMRWSVQFRLR